MMRITIDATALLLRSAGIKGYLYHWIGALRRLAGPDQIRAFPFLKEWGALDHDGSMLGKGATLARIAALHFANYGGPAAMRAVAGPCDIFHASNQVHHAPPGVRLTATIHDLTCWLMPEMHTPANVAADRRFAERILKRADGLIAVSEHTRKDAIRLLGIAPEKIVTIYSGVPETYFHVPMQRRWETAKRYGLERPYVLFTGTLEPRKNLGRLLDAWKGLQAGVGKDFELAIAGPRGWGGAAIEQRLAAGVPGVRRLGYVPEDDLPALTAGAALFAYPSLYEGFGFPVVQAMAAGVAVLASNVSSLPEITGDAAVLVDPLSDFELRNGLLRLLSSEARRKEHAEKGRRMAGRYRWENCARRSLEFFERLAS